jgi:hypothetical protein
MASQADPDTIETKTGQTSRKVVAGYCLSLDGVAEAPDRFITAWDDETDASGAKLIATQDTVILGRRSYDEWAEFWPAAEGRPVGRCVCARSGGAFVPGQREGQRRASGPSPSSAARIWPSHSMPSRRPFGNWSLSSQRHVVTMASTRVRHTRSRP